MESNPKQRLSDRFADIESWMIPILLLLILVVGVIRITPWIKEQLFQSGEEVTAVELQTNSADEDTGIEVDLALSPVILEGDKGLPEARSEDLTNSLNKINETLTIEVQTDAADSILTNEFEMDQILAQKADVIEVTSELEPIISTSEPALVNLEEPLSQEEPAITPTAAELDEELTKSVTTSEPKEEPLITSDVPDTLDTPAQAIAALMDQWALAWANKDINQYLAAYSPDHKGQKHATVTQWREWRKQRLLAPKEIQVKIYKSNIFYNANSPKYGSAQFTQDYQTPNFSDTVIKRLEFEKTSTGWKIIKESTLDTLKVTRS